MKISVLSLRALGACVAAMLLGCGGSQPPIGAPGAMPQASAPARHVDRGKSWMLPEAKGENLVYVSDGAESVFVYTYPKGQLVGTLSGFIGPLGECVDPAGDLFIAAATNLQRTSGIIYEYAHGGTTPIATLADPNGTFGCAVDPRSGDLAVTGGGVAVYTRASGQPVLYDSLVATYFCGYDNSGDLYLSTATESGPNDKLDELAEGNNTLKQISLNAALYGTLPIPPSVQWDGRHIMVSSASQKVEVGYDGPISLYRLHISGDSATVVGTTTLSSKKNARRTGQIWIQGKRVLGSDYYRHSGGVDSWSYPSAGKSRRIVPYSGEFDPFGIVVSPAVSHQSIL
jgi:hypothetical protein